MLLCWNMLHYFCLFIAKKEENYMILVFSTPEYYDNMWDDEVNIRKESMHLPLNERSLVDLLRYFGNLKLTEEETDNISCIYVLNYKSKMDLNKFYFDEDFSAWFHSPKLVKVFHNIKPFTENTWHEIINKSQSEKVTYYSRELVKTEAKELSKIPSNNLELYLDSKKRKYEPSVINFILDFPLFYRMEKNATVLYGYGEMLLNLFQDNKLSLPSNSAYVLNVNSDDFELTDFLLAELTAGKNVFWYYDEEDLEELNDKYDVFVVSRFNLISIQKQNTLWNILKGYGFDKKPVIIVGKDSYIIPAIKSESFFVKTEPFDFKTINGDILKFLYYYYFKTNNNADQFLNYWIRTDEYHKKIFFKAINFNTLLKALSSTGIDRQENFFDPLALYRLTLQIEKFNNSEEEKHSSGTISTAGYLWKFRGDFWEISFNYTESIFVRDAIGFFYIAVFLEKAGSEVNKIGRAHV